MVVDKLKSVKKIAQAIFSSSTFTPRKQFLAHPHLLQVEEIMRSNYSRKERQKIVEEYIQSEKSQTVFAPEYGIKPNTF